MSVVMPCLNEEESIGACITKIQETFRRNGIEGEIVVCDNGSTDRSAVIARELGAVVVSEPVKGYGNAYLTGFRAARGEYLIMGDADDTYDFSLIPKFLEELTSGGFEFVTGSRYLSHHVEEIPLLHRVFGNPALTRFLNFFFGTSYTDVYCGLRGFSREAYDRIQPVTPGMEFNLELAINAGLAHLKTKEIPITLGPRKGVSKLRTFRDGWRSLRMMLLYCPNKVFLVPGTTFLLAGIFFHVVSLFGLIRWDGRPAGSATSACAAMFTIIGFQIISLGLHAKTYSWSHRFDSDNATLDKFYGFFTFEKGCLLGTAAFLGGAAILAKVVMDWLHSGMQPLQHPEWLNLAVTLIVVGSGTVFSTIFISAMSMKRLPSGEVRPEPLRLADGVGDLADRPPSSE